MFVTSEAKVAIVTGSTKGIGNGIARQLAENGATVVITSRDIGRAEQAAEEFKKSGYQARGLQFDLGDGNDIESLIQDVVGVFDRLDILVNNAFTADGALPLAMLSNDQIKFALTANVAHTFLLCRQAYPYLKKTKGNIINISSVVANRHLMGLPLYGIIKGAIVQMTKVLAAEWAADGIRVNAINPGFTRTNAFSELGMPPDMIEKSYEFYSHYHPLGKIGKPSELGKLAAYLVSDDAQLMTGSIIEADGGYSIQGLPLYEPH